ncbi:MAG: hypothetical protein MZW92_63685 [Comamonadaceae bacterium]|nr:hypothetical protein [Comamonadaceae bacterium]
MNGLPELEELERLVAEGGAHLRVATVCRAEAQGRAFPVRAVVLGSEAPDVPAVGFFGGIHGARAHRHPGGAVLPRQPGGSRLRWDSGAAAAVAQPVRAGASCR